MSVFRVRLELDFQRSGATLPGNQISDSSITNMLYLEVSLKDPVASAYCASLAESKTSRFDNGDIVVGNEAENGTGSKYRETDASLS